MEVTVATAVEGEEEDLEGALAMNHLAAKPQSDPFL